MVSQIAIQAAQAALQSLVNSLISSVQTAMSDMFNIFDANINEYMDTFFAYDMRPALANQTAQLHTMVIDNARAFGSMLDAQELNNTVLLRNQNMFEGDREHRTSPLLCEAASLTSGLQRANTIKKAYARAAPIAHAPELEASADDGTGSPTTAAQGPEFYQNALVQNYCTRYHNPAINNGQGICPGAGGYPDEDLNAANLFTDTYDVRDVNLKKNLDDFVRNAVGIRPIEPVNVTEIDSKQGRDNFMETQSYMARQQLALGGMHRVVSCIVPGSDMGGLIQIHRTKAGVDPLLTSDNPSWCEVERAILESSAADLQTRLAAEEPENVDRFLATMGIYQLTFGMSEISDLRDYETALHATQAALIMDIIGDQLSDMKEHMQ